jgi:hypothetical protein
MHRHSIAKCLIDRKLIQVNEGWLLFHSRFRD